MTAGDTAVARHTIGCPSSALAGCASTEEALPWNMRHTLHGPLALVRAAPRPFFPTGDAVNEQHCRWPVSLRCSKDLLMQIDGNFPHHSCRFGRLGCLKFLGISVGHEVASVLRSLFLPVIVC